MKIRRLHVTDFAVIREADVEFGPGLNVLFGPNDLGKSTLTEAIRLALLLPHTSTHIDEYIPWTGGQNPVVELTFETESQRIWRVRKEFRKGGAATLEESRNGVDFDPVERARKVDAKLQEILRWGIPEPGGARGGKGLPSSFLGTALLSTQAKVTSVLSQSLSDDPTGTGKERIAAALQAAAQDPLFAALLRETQARRDQAYTERGAKKTARGSVFKDAADRVKETRNEKERLQKLVDDSESVEKELRKLMVTRIQREEALASAAEHVKIVEQFASQAAALSAAAEQVHIAREEVERIRGIDREVAAAEHNLENLAIKVAQAEEAVNAAQRQVTQTETAWEVAKKAATADGADSGTKHTLARQGLELRRVAADQALIEAQRRVDAALAAQKVVDAVTTATTEHQKREVEAKASRTALAAATAAEQSASEQIDRLDLLERAVEARAAEEQAVAARSAVEQEESLRARLESETRERDGLAARRAAIVVPPAPSVVSMRRLANELAGARGALSVGLVVTVTPQRVLELQIRSDGTALQTTTTAEPTEIEASADVSIGIGGVADVRIRGGRRQAQDTVRQLEKRWNDEVAPHLAAAAAEDLDGLALKVEEAQAADAAIRIKDAELQSLQGELASLAGSAEKLSQALERAQAWLAALGGVSLDSLASEVSGLGSEPMRALRACRQELTETLGTARASTAKASTDCTLAEERHRASQAALNDAIVARDTELAKFSESVTAELSVAEAAAAAAAEDQKIIATEFASLESTIAEQTARIEEAVRAAREAFTRAREDLELTEEARTEIVKEHAAEGGRLEALRKQRESQDLKGAETRLAEATDRQGALPVPATFVTEADVTAARAAETRARGDLDRVVGEIHKAQGALEQVGGTVARERLRDAIEAFELAERHEREIETEYDAWLLLLEQMKQADAAQASNLGQALAPAITTKFEALTQKRYGDVRLTAQLVTEGIVVAGTIRPAERISVGTREQLSTLYRLCLAEYLGTTVVLDDQLVQSDVDRMDWFRALLAEKARAFQIIVFTCRPADYVSASAMPSGKVFQDTDGGFIRATALGRAIQRR
jgi:hypothetical protein